MLFHCCPAFIIFGGALVLSSYDDLSQPPTHMLYSVNTTYLATWFIHYSLRNIFRRLESQTQEHQHQGRELDGGQSLIIALDVIEELIERSQGEPGRQWHVRRDNCPDTTTTAPTTLAIFVAGARLCRIVGHCANPNCGMRSRGTGHPTRYARQVLEASKACWAW